MNEPKVDTYVELKFSKSEFLLLNWRFYALMSMKSAQLKDFNKKILELFLLDQRF